MQLDSMTAVSNTSILTMREVPAAEAISSKLKAVDPYLSWNEQTRLDRLNYNFVMLFDHDSLSLFDLSDPGLFLFPSLSPGGRSESPDATDDSISTETMSSDDVAKVIVKAPSRCGAQDICPTYWRSETPDESKPDSSFCSLPKLIVNCQTERLGQISDDSSLFCTRANSPNTCWTCEACGRRCRDLKALQQHKRCHLKPFQCPDTKCYLRFSTRRDLSRHRAAVHSAKPMAASASCPFCTKRFVRMDNLKRHITGHRKLPTA
ncbi:hypothetical protein BR93DRAFT_360742 [Coniochaeta sp. PMI_546]|nr:hypothetical protein BR93DRAFT_360742 [Coniochaeta sp. PMI_546]